MKKILLTLLASLVAVVCIAIPAKPGKRTTTQPDGTAIEYFVHGDETYHYMTDTEGFLLEKDSKGFLIRTGQAPTEAEIIARRAASTKRNTAAQSNLFKRRIGSAPISKGIVILVNYNDVQFKAENSRDEMWEMLNGENYTYNGATGSVRQYYIDQSYGQFEPTFDVFGPVTLSNNMAYYGGNDRYGNDSRVGQMVKEAVIAAKEQYNIDFSEYDGDGDGYVDFVDILYAGYGEADSYEEDAIWPCEWDLYSSGAGVVQYDGVRVNTFSCHQELDGSSGRRAGVGTPVHEFGHVFGLPDLYDTSYRNATLGDWDVMDAGSYNNNSRTPPGFSAYERFYAGWLTPEILNEPANITMQALNISPDAYIITSTGNHNLSGTNPSPNTFFLLENRQQTGWDRYLPGHGMLIWKIQYSSYSWTYNTVNNAVVSKQGVAIMAADGAVYSQNYQGSVYTWGDDGDTYPGSRNITHYTPFANYPITSISENNGVISFAFMNGVEELHTVYFNAGSNGSCEISSLTEDSLNAGVVLPEATPNEGYNFIGWGTDIDGAINDAGKAGDIFYPEYDLTLYAKYTTRKYNISYEVENVTINPRWAKADYGTPIYFRIQVRSGYEIGVEDIFLTMGGEELKIGTDYTYQNNRIDIPAIKGDVYLRIIARKYQEYTDVEDILSADRFFIRNANSLIFNSESQVTIYDINGKLINNMPTKKGTTISLHSGLYLIHISIGNQTYHYKILF